MFNELYAGIDEKGFIKSRPLSIRAVETPIYFGLKEEKLRSEWGDFVEFFLSFSCVDFIFIRGSR